MNPALYVPLRVRQPAHFVTSLPRLSLVGLLLSATLCLCLASAGQAATVTDFGDTGAPGQLRTLINAAAPGDTIVIPAGTIALSMGELLISVNLTIQGQGASSSIIDGGDGAWVFNVFADRVFEIATGVVVDISGLTIQRGNASPYGLVFGLGGGILNRGTLTVTNSLFWGNEAGPAFSWGGGIANYGMLTVNKTRFVSNDSTGGGGIYNAVTATVNDCDFVDNVGTEEWGGGIRNGGTLTVTNSRFVENWGDVVTTSTTPIR